MIRRALLWRNYRRARRVADIREERRLMEFFDAIRKVA